MGAAHLQLVGGDMYPDWEAIYRDNAGRVYRMLYAKVGNRADAEDLTTEVFLAALRPLRTSASVGEVRAYLLAAAAPRSPSTGGASWGSRSRRSTTPPWKACSPTNPRIPATRPGWTRY